MTLSPKDQAFTIKEILVDVRDKLDAHIEASNDDLIHVEQELAKRPTWSALGKVLGVIGTLVGIAGGLYALVIV